MIVWVDVETTGLDERAGCLLEVAVVATDDDLAEVGGWLAPFSRVVWPASVSRDVEAWRRFVEGLDPVVRGMHVENGLFDEVLRSTYGSNLECVKENIVTWARALGGDLREVPLAGSTVGFDRRWLRAHAPAFEALFSHRAIDVSSVTELARRWVPSVYEGRPKAAKAHRALADVRESIEYLRYYRRVGFVGGAAAAGGDRWRS